AARDQAYALMVLGRAEADRGGIDTARVRLRAAHRLFTGLGLPDADDVSRLLDHLPDRPAHPDAP
ncbi:hypothetical protein, partial [Streptomyces shenzhenensis]|uniref:hypothetical protein n=1 Tax=Streptomyces shenzhenensis TaxID=943815 RepID=UPI001F35F856